MEYHNLLDHDFKNFKKFFLGANTAGGFLSFFNQLGNYNQKYKQNWKSFLIKGGPGTGKSSLIKSIATDIKNISNNLELIYCSSDPKSLDGLVSNDKKFSIVDATAPHVLEPSFPGAFENTISMCDCWNECILQENKNQITDLFEKNSFYLSQARNLFLSAYGLIKNNFDIINQHINKENLKSYFADLIKFEPNLNNFNINNILCSQSYGQNNNLEQKRLLSVISYDGPIFFQETISQIAEKIYVIEDSFGPVSSYILENLRTILINQNINIITCYCSIFKKDLFNNLSNKNKIDHILIPDLKIAFVTSNKYHNFTQDRFKTIISDDFVNFINHNLEDQIKFNQNQISKIFKQSENFIKQAKTIHDQLENCYFKAMDFSLVNLKIQNTTKNIKKFLKI